MEVVSDEEMEIALRVGAKVIGVNNRNLHTFEMDRDRTSRLAKACPEGVYLMALSGISEHEDVARYLPTDGSRQAVTGILVGEALMRADDPSKAIEELMALKSSNSVASDNAPLVKICGVTDASDAQVAVRAGAKLIGCIFVQKSKRCCSVEKAKAVTSAVRELGERPRRVVTPAQTTHSHGPSPCRRARSSCTSVAVLGLAASVRVVAWAGHVRLRPSQGHEHMGGRCRPY